MEKTSDSTIFNAVLILNDYKNSPSNFEEDWDMIKNRVVDWETQYKLSNNLTDHEYSHLMSWKPSQREFEIAKQTWRPRPQPPPEVLEARMLLNRLKNQIENVL